MKQLILFVLLLFTISFSVHCQDDTTISIAEEYKETGKRYFTEAQFDSSSFYFQKAAYLYENLALKHSDKQFWREHIRCLHLKARNYVSQINYIKSQQILNKALKKSLQRLGENYQETANLYIGLGFIYRNLNNYDLALSTYSKAIKILERNEGLKKSDIGIANNNIGDIYVSVGHYDLALKYYQKALASWKTAYGAQHNFVALAYNNIAIAHNKIGSYDLALEYHQEAYNLRRELFGPNNLIVSQSLNNIGIIYQNKGDFNLALNKYQHALAIRIKSLENQIKHLSNTEVLVSNSYLNIGSAYKDTEDFDQALKYYQKALDIQKKIFGENHLKVALSYNNIGVIFQNKGLYKSALEFYHKALNIRISLLGNKNPEIVYSYNNIGIIHEKTGLYNIALKYFQKGICANFENFNDSIDYYKNPTLENYYDQNYLLTSLELKAKNIALFNTKQDLVTSLETYQLCDQLIDKIQLTHLKESDKIALSNTASNVYDGAIEVIWALVKASNGFERKAFFKKIFYFSEKSKSSILLTAVNEISAKQFGNIPDSLLQKERELRISKSFYEQKLTESPNPKQEMFFKDKLFNINRNYEILIASFEKTFPKYYNLKHNQHIVTIEEIQDEIDNKTSLIEYHVKDSTLYTLLIQKDQFKIIEIPFTFSLRDQILKLNKSIENANEEDFVKYAFNLYRLLIAPIENDLKGNKLIIIPDEVLWYLSFDLLIKQSSGLLNFKDLDYLIKHFTISYDYSANLLVQEKHRKYQAERLECIGFSYSKYQTTDSKSNAHRTVLHDLPGSRKEVEAVSKIMEGSYYHGLRANEENFKSYANKYSIIHLALHGQIDEYNPMNSKLYFVHNNEDKDNDLNKTLPNDDKQLKDNEETDDGFLHAYELYNMNLNAELVVLSACNTGTGKLETGEGVMSLGRAFTYAGCKSMLISQWKLSDYTTPILMQKFYKQLRKGKRKDEALRNAKIDFIKYMSDNNTSNPFYWAGLVQVGDYSALPTPFNWLNIILAFFIIIVLISFIAYLFYRKPYVS